ncbi:MAG: adenylosuccinate synthase [Kiritimatiellae bacterium]|nr:adenylosuccinate synthase [Kiritimatiellia bacterium]
MPSIVIVGAQWGDEGKGKIVDALAARADVVVRFQGGDNAGHTVYSGDKKYVFHILPSGILRSGVLCVIGGGVVLNLKNLGEELQTIRIPETDWRRRLRISGEVHLILPCHIAMDQASETLRGKGKIGTTLRGIGPAYADRAARTGVRLADTLDESWFRTQLRSCLDAKRGCLPEAQARDVCDADRVADEILALAKPYAGLIADAGQLLADARRKRKNILFEGAQGTMLDVGAGTYPYVTSSHTVAGGVCVGAGVGPHDIDRIIGVVKAYTTRVGEGPFPSELHDATGEMLRKIGGEYGATTGRPRRCGWLDLVQLRRAVRLNSLDEIVVTKLDVLDALDRIGICTAYRVGGRRVTEWPVNPVDVQQAEPEWEYLPGWQCATDGVTTFAKLPKAARRYIRTIEKRLEVPVTMISAGKDRAQLIIRKPAFGKK